MKRKGLRRSVIFLFAFFCIVGMARAEVGVTDTEIKVGTHMALTGPAAVVGKPIAEGMKAYFQYINAQGGVHGRKFVLVEEDDAFLPSRAKEAVKKLIAKDKVFCIQGPLQGAGILASVPEITRAKIPVVWIMSALDDLYHPTKRYIFGWCISYGDSANLLTNYAVKELNAKRFAFVNQWGPVGDVNVKAAEKMTKKLGVELLMNEKLKNIKMDYSGLVSKMKNKNVDCVVLTPTAQWTIPILKEIERQGWKVNRIVGMASANPALLAHLGGSAAEGAYVTMNHVPTDYNGEPMITYRKALAEYDAKARPSMYNFTGYALSKMVYEGLDQVGRDVTREKLIDNYESWKNYETGWIGKITLGPNDHVGQEGQIMVQMVNGKGKVLGPRIFPVK